MNKKKLNKKKGFTLIELIVVIAILGILAAIAIPQYTKIQNNARISADKATYDSINNAINAGVASGDITGNVVIASAATSGAVSVTSGATDLLQTGSSFKLADNMGKSYTWTVAAGAVAGPGINTSTGKIN